MIRRFPLVLALALGVAACDEATTLITHVDRLSHVEPGDLVTMQDSAGLRVEIHGIPWKGATDAELAAALHPPPGEAQDVRFQSVPPGQWVTGRGHRLVLHFNPSGPPNPVRDCQATAEMRTDAPQEVGFRVTASFCTRDRWIAHGYMEVPKIEAGDWETYTEVMQQLMMVILTPEKDQ